MVTLDTPQKLFTQRLGAALTMEYTVLRMLRDLQRKARHEDLRSLFRRHAQETDEQISNLGRAFAALDQEPDKKPCPAVKVLHVEGKAAIRLAEGQIVDDVVLAAAVESKHYEIALYEELLTFAEAMGREGAAEALRANLAQEREALDELRQAAERVAQETLQPA
jgi:ferritin-like metal-binding protein YciE